MHYVTVTCNTRLVSLAYKHAYMTAADAIRVTRQANLHSMCLGERLCLPDGQAAEHV